MNIKNQKKVLLNTWIQNLEHINNHCLSYLYSQLHLQFEALENSLIAFRACFPRFIPSLLNPKVVLGNPLGEPSAFKHLAKQFTKKNKHCFFLHVHQHAYKTLKQLNVKLLYIGNQHRINLVTFNQKNKLSKRLKKNCHRAQKRGVLIKEIVPQQLDPTWLKIIQDTWIAQKKGPKIVHGFLNTPLKQHNTHTRCFAAYLSQRIVSVRFFSPLYEKDRCVGYTANSCYYAKDCPQGSQAYLIFCAAQQFQKEGLLYLNLGLSPLDHLLSKKKYIASSILKPQYLLLNPLKSMLNPIYNLHGLYRFKRQFKAKKIPTYVAFNSTPSLFCGFFVLFWIYFGSKTRSKPV